MLINIEDVADLALGSAIAFTGRRISAALARPRGRRAEDLDVARWFETYRLTREVPELPDMSPAQADKLAAILNGDEIQAGLQELLAARLTDAPEADAARARKVICLTLNAATPEAGPAAEALADHYDDEICALVSRLSAYEPQLLAQIRGEAFFTRMIATLNAIERHTAALSTRPNQRTEAAFLASYRRHVTEQHGKLEPPDFDRRRRVPIGDIYVPTLITEDLSSERTPVSRLPGQSSLDVYDLAKRLDRSVLLGDPGGGKTTAANVLMHHFASDAAARVPFLVTLRDFAAKDPPERSVAGHIEHTLETFYQCPSPPGLVDLLLLAGRAVVIFDGLDELLDTARRIDVTARVEHFCTEYPLAPVLVTVRLVGYDEARLDDRQFTCYRLGGFGDEQVAEYARKWFAQDREPWPGDAEAFVSESADVPDLRSNPLMLALLCILHRGEGSLPRNRAEVYQQCATMLYRRWDARRRIHRDLRAGHLLEPTLRHLAWWLFARDDAQSAVAERELIAETTEFLHERGFESEDDAREAAHEFVEFCRGRMWVFSDAGTTATGEHMYAFTHRTFLEYFAAAWLAYDNDTAEQLAGTLASRVARGEWWVVAELAIQIKDRTSTRGAERIYAALLGGRDWWPADERASALRFLSLCLRSADPSPQRVRDLSRQVVEDTLAAENANSATSSLTGVAGWVVTRTGPWHDAVRQLIISCGSYCQIVADQIGAVITEAIGSGDRTALVNSLRLVVSLPSAAPHGYASSQADRFWDGFANDLLRTDAAAAAIAAEDDAYVRRAALAQGVISAWQALDTPDGLSSLFQQPTGIFGDARWQAYLHDALDSLMMDWPLPVDSARGQDLTAIGEYLLNHQEPPWIRGEPSRELIVAYARAYVKPTRTPAWMTALPAYLGAVALLLIIAEWREVIYPDTAHLDFGPLPELYPYLARRRDPGTFDAELPELQVPDEFKEVFREWADRRVNFTGPD